MDDVQIDLKELEEKQALGLLPDVQSAAISRDLTVDFREGSVRAEMFARSVGEGDGVAEYEAIGLGNPISVELLTAYRGDRSVA